MSKQAPDPTPNFSKMVLCNSVGVQVGNLIGKCASFPRAMKNQNVHSGSRPYLQLFQNGPLQFCSGSGSEPEWEMCFLPVGHKKSTMSSQAPDPTPNFSKIALCSSVRGSGWGPEWKMCFPSPGHKKSTMSNQACDPTPNFSKMVLCSSVRVQVGNLSGKCDSFPRP